MFSLFRKACLLYKTSKIVFPRFVLTIYDLGIHEVTRGYRGLQGVTGGYKGLQGVTRGYKGLQRVTGGDKELRATTKDHKNFFLTRTFPDTFSWSILHKKPKLKKCQIFDQNHGLTPFETMPILWVFETLFFVVQKGFFAI